MQNGKDNAMLAEWNTIRDYSKTRKRWLGKVNQPLRTAHPSL
jgi:hypothetical protein